MCLGRPPELIEWLTFPIPITNFRGNFCFSNIFFVFSISFTSGLKPPPREKPSFAFCLEAVMFRMTIMHVHVLLYCHIWRTTWSIPLTIPNTVPCWWHFSLVFLQGKRNTLEAGRTFGIYAGSLSEAWFWTLGVPGELVDESFKWSSLFLSHGF